IRVVGGKAKLNTMVGIFIFEKQMGKFFVYILKGKKHYVGYTSNLENRLLEHRKGTTKTTRELGEWNLIKVIECDSKTDAIRLERKIKKGGHIERWVD
ncbi:MAG TPA: GIY-YIG nuclease family protein, partial [Candidatus Absconditabacterales bacterium]|nr:GIY-YIG nuclease family protein [Candidatus Absconditabacterales bacterium]HRU50187.1 GIY-YIG nuclease family protein [Candidatus Absconditabacterales bacterium]